MRPIHDLVQVPLAAVHWPAEMMVIDFLCLRLISIGSDDRLDVMSEISSVISFADRCRHPGTPVRRYGRTVACARPLDSTIGDISVKISVELVGILTAFLPRNCFHAVFTRPRSICAKIGLEEI